MNDRPTDSVTNGPGPWEALASKKVFQPRDCFKQFERIAKKNALILRSLFELEKCFFKWVRISPEIDWYHYKGTIPAPTCIVRHQTLIKSPTSKVSHQSPVCVCRGGSNFFNMFLRLISLYRRRGSSEVKTMSHVSYFFHLKLPNF